MAQRAVYTERDLKRGGYRKPEGCGASPFSIAAQALHEEDMRVGSRLLLAAIWKRHPRAMMVARARGRMVVRP